MKIPALAYALFLSLSLAPAADSHNTLTDAEKKDGWQLLFDGKSFTGWRGYRQKAMPAAGWEIQDGTLKTVPKVKGSEIITEQKYGDLPGLGMAHRARRQQRHQVLRARRAPQGSRPRVPDAR